MHALVQPQGGEVERVVALLHHLVEERQIEDRALANLDARVARRGRQVAARPTHEVVDDDHALDLLGEQLIDDVRADEAGAADDCDGRAFDLRHEPSPFLS